MNKISTLLALLALSIFNLGCENPAQKKADADKKAIQAEADINKAAQDANAKKVEANQEFQKEANKAQGKLQEANDEAIEAGNDAVRRGTR